ncbi:MAG: hypothetical protein GX138_04645 [Firmicutes bacterium]|jgi:type I restriction enzyme S subunit|nr:hypothetical protein [Bacillota bacterium]
MRTLVPKRRFAGFSGEWEERKLGEVTSYLKGFAFKSQDYRDEGVRIIRSSDLLASDIEVNSNNIYIDEQLLENFKDYKLNKGEIIVTTVGSKSEMKDSAVGRAIFVNDDNIGLLNQNLVKISTNRDSNSYFVYHNLLRKKYSEFIGTIERGNANQANITIAELLGYEILVPNLEEQIKIGNFFSNLDNLISLNQQKLDKLKATKSAYLSEMFPREGELYPKRRFPGFTEPWEEKKMKDIFPVIQSGNRLPKVLVEKGEIPYVIATVENNGVLMEIDKETLDYHGNEMKLFKVPSITFSIDNPEAIFLQEKSFFASNIMRVLNNPSLNSYDYLFFLEILRRLTSGFDWSVKFSGPVVLELDIMVPTINGKEKINYKEIRKIGNFFSNLDSLISAQQNKLEKLKALKQAYLAEMFV